MIGNQVIYTMFEIKSFIHMDRFVPHGDQDEDLGLGVHYVMCFSQATMDIILVCKIFQYNHHAGNLNDIYIVT
jgi:hypothetical protein